MNDKRDEMVNQSNEAIARRKFLQGAGWITLCSIALPFRSLSDTLESRELQVGNIVCPECRVAHGDRPCVHE